ncbi:helix-turn-helix domain-containing protein [Gordonia alkanivorans]|uniref:helix-turn-helix domain-containing protein n=1 Tax=Gordonia alkanivorans TaxID=84096 RepID=UPI00244BEC56|nr:helix-turn-helix domain-containing protein [Gordonia alkanivorans]MDH3007099.1 helix-turn-helix domain-containing protein [Gordonia alkanivorans]MDH3015027.1 helix-turn-helix domain-containing protein [Gordonia alkanivorans]MDH3021614.1 helix-turn-helix domain-containing protein [Gordonia alkanivorans]MDH3040163.1 helix-turn-helix domain-containing protein [Gordonia alkanivorans]MDH3059421.1 helix-turn-helix domain-containing protein [Gordonia alkanivorans]
MTKGTVMQAEDVDQFPEEVRNQSTEALKRLRDADLTKPVDVQVDDQEPITLPPVVLSLLAEVLAKVAADQPVSIVTPDTIFTTQQAAEVLNVSRPYVVKLIAEGELPATKVGRHRRIKASDLEEYRRKQYAASRAASRAMADLTADWEQDD